MKAAGVITKRDEDKYDVKIVQGMVSKGTFSTHQYKGLTLEAVLTTLNIWDVCDNRTYWQ